MMGHNDGRALCMTGNSQNILGALNWMCSYLVIVQFWDGGRLSQDVEETRFHPAAVNSVWWFDGGMLETVKKAKITRSLNLNNRPQSSVLQIAN